MGNCAFSTRIVWGDFDAIIGQQITLDGTFTDWPAADKVMTAANAVAGYQVYGAFLNDSTLGNTYVIGVDATGSCDAAIGAGTIIYLNTDQNNTTGLSGSWAAGAVGAEHYVEFGPDLRWYLYSMDGTLLNGGAPIPFGMTSDGKSVELAIQQSLLTPSGGSAPAAINFEVLFSNGSALPSGFNTQTPQYVIVDPAAAPAPTTIANTVTLDGTSTDWPTGDMIMTSGNTVPGYQVYGALLNDANAGKT